MSKSRLVLLQAPKVVLNTFSPLKEFGHMIQEVIMPIVVLINGDLIHMGTAFAISPDGLLMTARHVVENINETRAKKDHMGEFADYHEVYAMYVTGERINNEQHHFGMLWPISNGCYLNDTDIGILSLDTMLRDEKKMLVPYLQLSPGIPKEGGSILGFGYHNATGSVSGKFENGEISNIKYSQDTGFTTGKIIKVHPEKRDSVSAPFPCLQTDATFEDGMSGGPILNEEGSVCAVVLSSFAKDISYATLLYPAMKCEIEAKLLKDPQVKKYTLFELIKAGIILTDSTINYIQVERIPGGIRSSIKQPANFKPN